MLRLQGDHFHNLKTKQKNKGKGLSKKFFRKEGKLEKKGGKRGA